MTQDARFEDGGEAPLNIGAMDAEDVPVLSALVQDAVLTVADMEWQPKARRLAFLVNRIRHEDVDRAMQQGRAVERVRALLVIDGVLSVASQGIDRSDTDTVLQILALEFFAGDPPGGAVTLTLAGDGALRATVEAVEIRLRDVTRPYAAPSGKLPDHGA